MGQKHRGFRESRTPFPLREIRKNPRSMYARVQQAMAQFVLKIEKLGTFRLDCEYEIEYEYEFRISNQWRF